MERPSCVRCDEAPGVDELGYCGHCHWVVKAETLNGLAQLAAYLGKVARFQVWCRENGRTP